MKDHVICSAIYEKIGRVESVIDIGCGEGYLVNCLAQKLNRKVVGFDITDKGFNASHDVCKRFGTCHLIECVSGDVHKINDFFKQESFDAAILVFTLHHLEHPINTLRMIIQIIKTNGKIIIGDYWFTERKKKTECYRFTTKDMKNLLVRGGFRFLGADKIGKDFVLVVGEKPAQQG